MTDTPSTETPVAGDSFEEFNRAMGADGDATPYPAFRAARGESPVHGGSAEFAHFEAVADGGLQIFTAYTYEAVHAVLGDGDTFSSAGYEEVMGVVMGRSILMMDEPEHRAYRSLIQQAFTATAMVRWKVDLVEPLVHAMVDGLAADGNGHADLVRQLTFPFPVQVIADLLGLPAADLPEFHRLAVELIGVSVDWDRAVAASEKLRQYFCGLVAERRHQPTEDMISVLAHVEHQGQQLTDDEICAFLRLLLPAGAETTYRSSSNLLFGLLTHPDQLEAVLADRSLLPQAIEEGIRWEPPLLIIIRTATRDTEVCGTPIPRGATVICNMGSANHDETRWPDAEHFDIFRERRPHIGFAHGPHMCLGMHLARMETAVVVNAVLDRLPATLRLDPEAGEQYISGVTFRAPPALKVIWD